MDFSVKQLLPRSSGLFDFTPLYDRVAGRRWNYWADRLSREIPQAFSISKNGHLPMWESVFERLPFIKPEEVQLDQAIVKVRSEYELSEELSELISSLLKKLLPWRKGPFKIHDTLIDSEWNSSIKWQRLVDHIQPLHKRRILDVGCGNGYFAMRMLGESAQFVIGVDHYLRYTVQFHALKHFIGPLDAHIAPVRLESLPANLQMFDTVFSMGVLYHQRSPFDHLKSLFEALRSEGELVLETLVVEGDNQAVLVPQDTYAKMNNVWFLPSTLALEEWLRKVGFTEIKLISVSTTTIQEQRSTAWMPFQSLADFLNPEDSSLTIEGYPAPKRAIMLAKKP